MKKIVLTFGVLVLLAGCGAFSDEEYFFATTTTESSGLSVTTTLGSSTTLLPDLEETTTTSSTVEVPRVPDLVFQSGFESGSEVLTAVGTGAPCTDDIVGEDVSVDGYGNWETDLEGGSFGRFQFCFGGGTPDQRGVEIVADPADPTNLVLHTWIALPGENVSDDDDIPCNGSGGRGDRKARVQAVLKDNPNLQQFYYTVRLRLGDGFQALVEGDREIDWLTIGEFWNNTSAESGSFRVTLNLVKETAERGAPLRFGLKSDMQPDEATDKKWFPVWPEGQIVSIPVPIGEWFTLSVSLVEGGEDSGRVTVTVTLADDSQHLIADVTGFTYSPEGQPDGFASISPIKLYTSGELMCALYDQGFLLDAWWDDFAVSALSGG